MKTGDGAAAQTTCDMEQGGWTLIGEQGGFAESIYTTWLRKDENVAYLADGTAITPGTHASINAVQMAVNNASKVGAYTYNHENHTMRTCIVFVRTLEEKSS